MVRESYINQTVMPLRAFGRWIVPCMIASLFGVMLPFGIALGAAEALQGKEKAAIPLQLPSGDIADEAVAGLTASDAALAEEPLSLKTQPLTGSPLAGSTGPNPQENMMWGGAIEARISDQGGLSTSNLNRRISRSKKTKGDSITPIKLPASPEGSNGFTDSLVDLEAQEGGDDGKHTFFRKGAATDFFGAEVSLKDPDKVNILNSKRVDGLSEDSISQSLDRNDQRAGLKIPEQSTSNSSNPPGSPEEILARFGNPDQEPRIKPEQNAPDSYKGLLAALEVGDDALAYRYARQYVRYQRNLSERVKKLTELSQIALERDGLIPASEDNEDPNYELSNRIADSIEGNNSGAAKADAGARRVQLDQQTRELLRIAQSEEEKNIFNDESGAAKSADAVRVTTPKVKSIDQIRAEIAAKAKPDPKGKVLVQYFFRPTDRANQEMIKKIAEIAWEYRDVPQVGFVGFTIDRMSKNEIDSISSQLPMILPIRSGSDFAERLGIKRSPAVVIVSATTGEAHILSGKQDKAYLEEFVKRVHGREK